MELKKVSGISTDNAMLGVCTVTILQYVSIKVNNNVMYNTVTRPLLHIKKQNVIQWDGKDYHQYVRYGRLLDLIFSQQ
jgi:hypothetical protein